MFLGVIGTRHTEGYKLEVAFNDGAVKKVDLEDELYGEVFETLRDAEFFKQAKVNEEVVVPLVLSGYTEGHDGRRNDPNPELPPLR